LTSSSSLAPRKIADRLKGEETASRAKGKHSKEDLYDNQKRLIRRKSLEDKRNHHKKTSEEPREHRDKDTS
jgi:hypothetical protein